MTAGLTARWRAGVGTLRFRVTALAAVAVLVVLSVASVALVLAQRSSLTDNLDESLARLADSVARQLAAGGALAGADLSPDDDIVVAVLGPDGAVLAASPALAGRALAGRAPGDGPVPDGAAISTVALPGAGGAARLLSRTADGTTLQVAGSLEDVQDSAAALTRSLVIAVPLSGAVLAGIVWWSVGRALRPVEDIRAQVEQISGARLDRRVPEPATSDEIARLARTMNAMLGRLAGSAERQRRFVADASHELRSPLARIRSELEVDLAHPGSADPAATHASVLTEAVTLQRLVDDLLLLARSDGGALAVIHPEPVDLDDLVEGLAGPVRAAGSVGSTGSADGRRVRIDTRGAAPVQVSGDRGQLRRAIGNLLDNAVRHARSAVTVTVTESAGQAVVAIADDGPGVPPDRRDAVFERFTRLDDARGAQDGGAGLGLAIAREIAERHGGTLTLDPEHRPGARFVLTLPVGAPAP